jgi:hypothetical protein
MPICALSGLRISGFLRGANSLGRAARGLVRKRGQIVVDGELIKDDGLFSIERTAEVSRLIEAGVLRDQGGGIPSGWISTANGRIAEP